MCLATLSIWLILSLWCICCWDYFQCCQAASQLGKKAGLIQLALYQQHATSFSSAPPTSQTALLPCMCQPFIISPDLAQNSTKYDTCSSRKYLQNVNSALWRKGCILYQSLPNSSLKREESVVIHMLCFCAYIWFLLWNPL